MTNQATNREVAIRLSDITKKYRLGEIGTGTLTHDLESWWARIRGKEDPNAPIGQDYRLMGETFMALNGVDLTIYKGEALGIIGGNGAGKSTLLKLLSRVTGPTTGEIDIYGRVACMLEVGTGFNSEMTGRENVYMNGTILGMTKAEIDAKMEQIIEFSEVREFIDTPVKRYSSGMYVKLAFSVAAHLDSEIMIMDEVLAVGDVAFQKKCLEKMRHAARQQGRTVLYVSHNMSTIRQLCSRCIVLSEGKIIYDGDVETAINIYTGTHSDSFSTDIDLSGQRDPYLPKIPEAKLLRVQLSGKTEPVYEFDEDILFNLTVRAERRIEHPCLRLEIREEDNVVVGTACIHDLPPMEARETVVLPLAFRAPHLVPGKYLSYLVLYETLERASINLDLAVPAFTFQVVDGDERMKLAWNASHWGRVCHRHHRVAVIPPNHVTLV